jgi:hypothetical protein
MKIPRARIEEAASSDPCRYVLEYVNLKDGRLVATDGRILVSVPAEIESGDVEGVIPKEVFSRARQMGCPSVRLGKKSAIIRKKKDRAERVDCIDRTLDGVFPDHSAVTKQFDGKTPVVKFALDPFLLHRLTVGIGVRAKEGLLIEVFDSKSPIMVRPLKKDGRESFGIIMPMNGDLDD